MTRSKVVVTVSMDPTRGANRNGDTAHLARGIAPQGRVEKFGEEAGKPLGTRTTESPRLSDEAQELLGQLRDGRMRLAIAMLTHPELIREIKRTEEGTKVLESLRNQLTFSKL